MNRLFIFLLFFIAAKGQAQNKGFIDSLNSEIQMNLNDYKSCLYTELVQEGELDSIWFYSDSNNNLVFIQSLRYLGSIHNAEDWAFTDLLLDKGKVLYMRSWGYLDENLYKPDPQKAIIKVSESIRSYYKYSGESILYHEMREAKGPYPMRDSLLNSVPLKPKSGWLDCTDRVDRMIEEDYIKVYEKHCLE